MEKLYYLNLSNTCFLRGSESSVSLFIAFTLFCLSSYKILTHSHTCTHAHNSLLQWRLYDFASCGVSWKGYSVHESSSYPLFLQQISEPTLQGVSLFNLI